MPNHIRLDRSAWAIFALAMTLWACGGSTPTTAPPPPPPPASASVTAAAGGTVAAPGGPSVQVPAGALAADTVITVQPSSEPPPTGTLGYVYDLLPSGTTFSKPVTVSFPVPSGTTDAAVWTKSAGAAHYVSVPTTITGGTAVAEVSHFSIFVVGPVDLTGTWSGDLTYTSTPANGSASTSGSTFQVRDVTQEVGQVTYALRTANGVTADCSGTLAGSVLTATCTNTNIDGTCNATYVPGGTISGATWNHAATYTWAGASCSSAGTLVKNEAQLEKQPPPVNPVAIPNGDFSRGTLEWTTFQAGGGALAVAVESGALKVTISALPGGGPGVAPSSQLQVSNHGPLELDAGKSYRLTFDAWAAAARPMTVSVWENGRDTDHDGSPYGTYGNADFNLTTMPQTFTLDLTMPAGISNPTAGVCFFLGTSATTLYLDNVSMVQR